MSEQENKSPEFNYEGLTEEQQAVLKQIFTVHEIERAMLSRAIEVIVRTTGVPVAETVAKLAAGLDNAYGDAVQQEAKPAKQSIYVPKLVY